MKTIEINQMWDYIEAAPISMNLMFVGDSGIGKTKIMNEKCKEKGIFLKTLVLSHLEATESLGIPVRSDREYKGNSYPVLTTAIPEWVFELAEHKNAILFLDEFLCTQPSTMNSFLNFLTEKNVSGIDLSHVKVVACTNIGNYTFEPDTNMLARFCWFYVENHSMNEYINDKRIINSYRDECDRTGIIFEPRQLKPRCQEWLKGVKDDYLFDFYEGFTNRRYVMVNKISSVNDIISEYFEPDGLFRYKISDENISNMVSVMINSMPRCKKWDKTIESFVNLDMETISKISKEIEKLVE